MSLLHDFYLGKLRPEEPQTRIIEAHEQRMQALEQQEEDICASRGLKHF